MKVSNPVVALFSFLLAIHALPADLDTRTTLSTEIETLSLTSAGLQVRYPHEDDDRVELSDALYARNLDVEARKPKPKSKPKPKPKKAVKKSKAKKKPKTPAKKPTKTKKKPAKTTKKPTNPVATPSKMPKVTKCDPISKYTIDWFVKNSCKKPAPGACLFYTRGMGKFANAYAAKQSPKKTTIWEMWPDMNYRKTDRSKSNPLRCIFTTKTDTMKYFSNMSRAVAKMCAGHVMVMDANITPAKKTFKTVNQSGIWFLHEFPQLKANSRVNEIEAVSKDGKTKAPYWTRARGNAAKRGEHEVELEFDAPSNATLTDPEIVHDEDTWWMDDEIMAEFEHHSSIQARKAIPKQKNCRAAPKDITADMALLR
ncbi:hypothetical protein K504DRAFT_463424 [Pleomassaria siparia CBS 279.74]|uniref:ADP-ribosyl cyclase/cyclic ADP-ribose hydrolase n=1 Tax=Pleomassaria siparia CBS 279.74 TaxID=1314801 RepID=A0A6G1JU52_9PLEO|nr:hypothetical protein K504DRAFT_463424 [Pleomassaria siparia CBS 279.74]